MDYTKNLKAFLRKLPLTKMSGHQKFVAVAAIQCKGDLAVEVVAPDIRKQWRKSLLGIKYNPAFYDRAQLAGWVDPTSGKGKFQLTQAGLDNLEALVPDLAAGDLKKSGALIIVNRKATHTFDKFLRNIFAESKNQVLIADSWVDETIFDNVLDRIPKSNVIKLIYANPRGKFDARVKRFSQEYSKFSSKKYKHLHDRFIIVDDAAYVLGPSIKDAASNSPAVIVVLAAKEKNLLQTFFSELWAKAK
jgi:hypothetical protein